MNEVDLITSFGLDAGLILSINGWVQWMKDQLAGLPKWVERFYVALPFVAALLLTVPTSNTLKEAVFQAFKYGAAALILKNVKRVTIDGK